ncbi:hypothetical protein RF11_15602 [Thelohanellus kitauei]|uniref:Uncharacterized protein n=1 Tax=Thelohanellus kitauei TaxID=669202 RepID=A0A0C2N2M2_THEKT|nr:hypothetical protein RF11_15602 [Thelohanellus kitauei]
MLGLYEISAKHYELASSCMVRRNPKCSVVGKICAFEMYAKIVNLNMIQNNIKGLERCSVHILQNMDSIEFSRSFSSKYYVKSLEELVKYAQKHGIPKLLTKLKYNYMKYLFKEKGFKQALTFFDQVILKHQEWIQIDDLVELECVCICVLAILRREANATKENEDVCELHQEVENNSQNLSAKCFWECLKKRNIEGLEEAVKRLSEMNECHERIIEDPVSEQVIEDPFNDDIMEDPGTKKLFEDSGTEQTVEDPGQNIRRIN